MRTIILILFFLIVRSSSAQSQVDTATYAFPTGSHFILKLVDSKRDLKYTVLRLDTMNLDLDYAKTDSLFEKSPLNGTIECFFGKGIDQGGPFKTVLLIRNNSKFTLEYQALISNENQENFYKTSVMDLYPGIKSSELWNDHLSAIVLRQFRKK